MLTLPEDLRSKVKREARKHDITMNAYIVTVLEQFVAIQGVRDGKNTQGDSC